MPKYSIWLISIILGIWSGCIYYWFNKLNPSTTPTSTTSTVHPENSYTTEIANTYSWKTQVKTAVGTYCDIVTPTEAVEVEWTSKPYEAIGQALHYSQELNLRPTILFLEAPNKPSRKFVLARVKKVANQYNIKIWWYNTQTKILERMSP